MKRILSIIISMILTLTVSIPAIAATSARTKSSDTEKIELSVAIWGIQDGFDADNANNDVIFNDMEKKLNITIKPVQVTWNDWQDKEKMWAASGQLPDIFAGLLDPALYKTFAKQGIIKALPTDLSKYPNLKKIMSLSSISSKKINGKFYMIPRVGGSLDPHQAALSRIMLYRKDWAKEAGYTTQPKTFEEYVKMTKAVLKKHPEATGLSINTKGYLSTIFLSSFPEASNDSSWVKENGKWIPSYASTKMYTGIKQLRELYTDGILDKDFVIQKDADGVTKFQNGQAFSCFVGNNLQANRYVAANPKVTVENSLDFMMPFPAADGNRYCYNGTPYWSETYFNNKLSDKKFERALQLLDYMASDEYTVLKTNGIEGVDWKMSNGKAVTLLSADQTLQKKYPITSSICWLANWGGSMANSPKKVLSSDPAMAAYDKLFNFDTYKKYQQMTKPANINFDVMLMSTPLKDKADAFRVQATDEMVKVIIGKDDPVKMWQNVIKGFMDNGLDKAIYETTVTAAKSGIK